MGEEDYVDQCRYVEKGESGEEQRAVSMGGKCDAAIDNKSLRKVVGC